MGTAACLCHCHGRRAAVGGLGDGTYGPGRDVVVGHRLGPGGGSRRDDEIGQAVTVAGDRDDDLALLARGRAGDDRLVHRECACRERVVVADRDVGSADPPLL